MPGLAAHGARAGGSAAFRDKVLSSAGRIGGPVAVSSKVGEALALNSGVGDAGALSIGVGKASGEDHQADDEDEVHLSQRNRKGKSPRRR
jgi:hypothetical protein